MKIISLLGAFAVLSLMIVPAFSQPSMKGCACMPKDCHGKPAENCCSKSSDNYIFLSCTCPGLMASYSGLEYYDPGNSYFSKNGSRSPARPGSSGLTNSNNAGAFSLVFPVLPVAPHNVGPPDPDVVEYLPPSAKEVFLVLASDGPSDSEGHYKQNRSSAQNCEICPGQAQGRRDATGALLLSRCSAKPL